MSLFSSITDKLQESLESIRRGTGGEATETSSYLKRRIEKEKEKEKEKENKLVKETTPVNIIPTKGKISKNRIEQKGPVKETIKEPNRSPFSFDTLFDFYKRGEEVSDNEVVAEPIKKPVKTAFSIASLLTPVGRKQQLLRYATEKGILKNLAQETSRNIGSAGVTLGNALAKVDAGPDSDVPNITEVEVPDSLKWIFKDEPVKSVELRIAESELKVKEWGEKNPTKTMGQVAIAHPEEIAFIGVVGSVGLDLMPIGGTKKATVEAFKGISKIDDAVNMLLKMGVTDDLARHFAPDIISTKTDDVAEILIKKIAEAKKTTKATKEAGKLTVVPQGAKNKKVGERVELPYNAVGVEIKEADGSITLYEHYTGKYLGSYNSKFSNYTKEDAIKTFKNQIERTGVDTFKENYKKLAEGGESTYKPKAPANTITKNLNNGVTISYKKTTKGYEIYDESGEHLILSKQKKIGDAIKKIEDISIDKYDNFIRGNKISKMDDSSVSNIYDNLSDSARRKMLKDDGGLIDESVESFSSKYLELDDTKKNIVKGLFLDGKLEPKTKIPTKPVSKTDDLAKEAVDSLKLPQGYFPEEDITKRLKVQGVKQNEISDALELATYNNKGEIETDSVLYFIKEHREDPTLSRPKIDTPVVQDEISSLPDRNILPTKTERIEAPRKKLISDVLESGNVNPSDNKLVSSYTQSYYDTPEMARALPKAEVELGGPTTINATKNGYYKEFRNKAENAWIKTRETLVDDWERVRRIVEDPNVKVDDLSNPYEKEILMHGRVSSRMENLDTMAKTIDNDLLKLGDDLKIDDKIIRKDINDYLLAKHAPERNASLGEKAAGITDNEAKAILKNIEGKEYYGEIKKAADNLLNVNKETLDILLDSQVIDRKFYNTLRNKYANHVPLQRIFAESENIVDVLGGRGLDVKGTGLKTAKGSQREVDDIVKNILANQRQAITRAEKNTVDLSTLKLVRDNKKYFDDLFEEIKPKKIGTREDGSPIFERVTDPTVLQMREAGKPVLIKINDQPLAMALRGINRTKLDGPMKYIGSFTRLYSGLMTRFNPEFAFPNKIRDLQESLIYAASKKEIGAKGVVNAAKKEIKQESLRDIVNFMRGKDTEGSKLYKQMIEDGGTTGGMSLSTRKQLDMDYEKIQKINRSKPRKAARGIVEYVDKWNTLFEDSTRLTIYKTSLELGASRQRAAVLAKEASINFNKMGTGGPLVNALYMFSNASIQGSVKMLRAMKNPKVAASVTTAMVGSITATNEWNDFMDPEWRDKVSKWDRTANLTVVMPKPGFLEGDEKDFWYLNIPVSWGLKPLKVMTDYATDIAGGENVDFKDAADGVVAAVLEAYNPVGGTDSLSAAIPTILDLPVDVARNLSWTGGKIRPDWDQNAPDSIKYFDSLEESSTGKSFIKISEKLSEKGIEVSPANMNYAYQQYIGGAGRFVSKMINTITAVGKGEKPAVKELPFISRFLRKKSGEIVGAESKDIQNIQSMLKKQSKESFYLNKDAETSYEYLTRLPREQAIKEMKTMKVENKALHDKVVEYGKDTQNGLNYTEKKIKQLGVKNGERAKFLAEKLNSLNNREEKIAYYKNLREKKVISDEVKNQITFLLNRK